MVYIFNQTCWIMSTVYSTQLKTSMSSISVRLLQFANISFNNSTRGHSWKPYQSPVQSKPGSQYSHKRSLIFLRNVLTDTGAPVELRVPDRGGSDDTTLHHRPDRTGQVCLTSIRFACKRTRNLTMAGCLWFLSNSTAPRAFSSLFQWGRGTDLSNQPVITATYGRFSARSV